MDPRLDTGGWLALTRRGLPPRKMRRALPGAITCKRTRVTRYCCCFSHWRLSAHRDRSALRRFLLDVADGSIRGVDLDSGVVTPVTSGLDRPYGIAVDSSRRMIYWVEAGGLIRRARLDGSGVETLLDVGGTPHDIAVDSVAEQIYWIEFSANRIRSANLDGTNVRVVNDTEVISGTGIALDPLGELLYWAHTGGVNRMSLDGTNVEAVVSDNGFVRDLELDLRRRELYWANEQFLRVAWVSIAPTGGEVPEIRGFPNQPTGVVVNSISDRVFISTSKPVAGIFSFDRATDSVEALAEGLGEPVGLALGPSTVIDLPSISPLGLAVLVILMTFLGMVAIRHCDPIH